MPSISSQIHDFFTFIYYHYACMYKYNQLSLLSIAHMYMCLGLTYMGLDNLSGGLSPGKANSPYLGSH